MREREGTPPATIVAQMLAVAAHDTRRRLGELAGLPVTVVHGEEDALIPVDRGVELTALIPGARLVTVPAAGHMLTTDAEELTVQVLLEALSLHDTLIL